MTLKRLRLIRKIKQKILNNETTLTEAEEILSRVKTILKLIRWIGDGVAAIALSSIANFVY